MTNIIHKKTNKKTPIEEFMNFKENIIKVIDKFNNNLSENIEKNDILYESKEIENDSKMNDNNNNNNNEFKAKLFVRMSTRSPKDAVDKPPFREKLLQLMAQEFLISF